MFLIAAIVFHYIELIKSQLEHKVLYQLSQMLVCYWHYCHNSWLLFLHSSEQVNKLLISQIINGISRVLQRLLRYFNGANI